MPTLGTTVSSEPTKITDVLKFEIDSLFSREEVDLKADAGLSIGDVVELISTKYEKVVTANQAGGVFISRKNTALVRATADVTFGSNPGDGKKVTINSRDYTFETGTLIGADEVDVGTDADESLDNLISAINGGAGGGSPGTAYYVGSPVENPDVTAEIRPGDVMRLRAKVPGTIGNAITLTTDVTDATVSNATLEGGAETDPATGVIVLRGSVVDGTQLNYNGATKADVDTALKALGVIVIG